jgi:hypothetical protein
MASGSRNRRFRGCQVGQSRHARCVMGSHWRCEAAMAAEPGMFDAHSRLDRSRESRMKFSLSSREAGWRYRPGHASQGRAIGPCSGESSMTAQLSGSCSLRRGWNWRMSTPGGRRGMSPMWHICSATRTRIPPIGLSERGRGRYPPSRGRLSDDLNPGNIIAGMNGPSWPPCRGARSARCRRPPNCEQVPWERIGLPRAARSAQSRKVPARMPWDGAANGQVAVRYPMKHS